MTRKDFEKFAEAFALKLGRFQLNNQMNHGAMTIVTAFMDTCEEINPRFDRERFGERLYALMGGA